MNEQSAGTKAQATDYLRPGLNSITPYLVARDAAHLIEFLKAAFGGTERLRLPAPDESIMHAEVAIGNGVIEVSGESNAHPAAPGAIHLYVEDADAAYESAVREGATSLYPVTDQPWGDRQGAVRDPFGNHWYIAKAMWTPGPEGIPAVQPFLHLRDAHKMIPFLETAFHAEATGVAKSPEGAILHATIQIGNATLEIAEAHDEFQPMPCHLHVYVPDTDAAYARALEAGATPIETPQDKPYGDRSAEVKDVWGNTWFIATSLTKGRAKLEPAIENRSVPPNTVLPHVVYRNVAEAIAWLTKTFGFSEHYHYGEPISGARLYLGNAWIMLKQAKAGEASPAELGYGTQSLTVFISDIDAHFEKAKSAGAKILENPHETIYGERQYGAEDLDGHHWLFSQHARDLNPDEWGAVVSKSQSRLALLPRPRLCYLEIPALDVSESVSFYEKVFGWSIRHRDSGRPAFDDATGNISGAWVPGRDASREPGLLPYIWVDNIDLCLAEIRAQGGQVVEGSHPDDPGSTCRIAIFRDVAENLIGLYQEEVQAED